MIDRMVPMSERSLSVGTIGGGKATVPGGGGARKARLGFNSSDDGAWRKPLVSVVAAVLWREGDGPARASPELNLKLPEDSLFSALRAFLAACVCERRSQC